MAGSPPSVVNDLTFPPPRRTKLHSTDPAADQGDQATDRRGRDLPGAVLLEQNDEWPLQQRYLSLETIAEIPAKEEPLAITELPPRAA